MTTDNFPTYVQPALTEEEDGGEPFDAEDELPTLIHGELEELLERLIVEYGGVTELGELEEVQPGLRRAARSLASLVESRFGM